MFHFRSILMASVVSVAAFSAVASTNPNNGTLGNYADLVYKGEGGGNPAATTDRGSASGKYQFTYPTLKSLGFIKSGPKNVPAGSGEWAGVVWAGKNGVNSREDFLKNVAAQDAALNEFTQSNWNAIQAVTPLGTTVNGVQMTQGGSLYAAHMLGEGGYKAWASCGFQSHCLLQDQADANHMTKEQLQAHMMNRLAEGGGYDPSVIASSGGGMGGSTPAIEQIQLNLMPWT